MASELNIGGSGSLFVGEDKSLIIEVLDSLGVPVNVSGWSIIFDIRKKDSSPEAILSKTPTVQGVYNATRSVNTQRVAVQLTSANMDLFKEATYRHSLKRTDSGSETVLAWGNFVVQKATAP